MYHKKFKELVREYAKKDKLYPDHGRSIRPWENPLREQIQAVLKQARAAGEAWAKTEPDWL